MIYVVCKPESFFYDIYEIINIYFPHEKIVDMKDDSAIPEGSMLIEVSYSLNDGNVTSDCMLLMNAGQEYTSLGSYSESCAVEDSTRKTIKYCIKLSVFKLLKGFTKSEIPWGILTGIRPSKIVSELRSKGAGMDEIRGILKSRYLIRDDKIKLVSDISNNSYDRLNCDKNKISVYIGIPFCPSICVYCSFGSCTISGYRQYLDSYIDALEYEITTAASFINSHFKIDTIYVGGGTPTSLNDNQFERLTGIICKNFMNHGVREFTIEAGRPDTIDRSKLEAMKAAGVSRISINPQSMNEDTLKRIGRNHRVEDIIEKYNLARRCGFDKINMDMILGLPGEDLDDVKNTLDRIIGLSPENITVHTMAIKRASKLKENIIENRPISLPENGLVEKMMDYVVETMDRYRYLPYYMYRQKMMVGNLENVGYCKPDFECIYNIQMIEERETIAGFGADAVTKTVFTDENRIERIANKKDIKEYINSIVKSTDGKIEALNMLVKD